MNVLEAIARSDELHKRKCALDTIIYMCERDNGMQGYGSVLGRIRDEISQEAENIKLKFEQIDFK